MSNLQIINPHNQEVVGEVKISTKSDIEVAVNSARAALASWRETPLEERAEYIAKLALLLKANKTELTTLIAQETGKPITEAGVEVDSEIDYLNYYAKEGVEALSDEVLNELDGTTYKSAYEPYGVVVAISPWNYPISMPSSGITPALLAGNTVVFKPSELSTLSSKMFADLFNEAGLPNGALTTVVGAGDVGQMLTDQEINMIWFTGSTEVGRELYRKAADKFIKVHLELGGSSPGVVFADANLDTVVEDIYWGRFFNCGQVCSALKRLFVHESILDELVSRLVGYVKSQKVGDPMEDDTVIGPMISKEQLVRVEEQVKKSVEMGAVVELGGNRITEEGYSLGNYFAPTILTDVTFDMPVMNEEVFGPVLPVVGFSTDDEAVEYANNTPYGLTAEIYIGDVAKGEELVRKIHAGSVGVNSADFFKPWCPFGGMKMSGLGREYGIYGIREFAQHKTVIVKT